MNQEQREYTVTQIRKNNDESKELAKIAANRAFMLGITTITTILAFGNLFQQVEPSVAENASRLILAMSQVGASVYWIYDLVSKLSKKANIEVMTEKLKNDLKMDDLEKGGKSR